MPPDLTFDGELLQDCEPEGPTDDDLEKAMIDDILDEDDEDDADRYEFTGDEDVEDIDALYEDENDDIIGDIDDELLEPGR
jgi:hypothetical protein